MNAELAPNETAPPTKEKQTSVVSRVVRRVHMFPGLFLAPWMFMYAVSTMVIQHLWIGSGLFMWWRLARWRVWGAVAVSGGILSFLLLVWKL